MTERVYKAAAELLAVSDIETTDVEVPEWGTWVRVRSMTAGERSEFEAAQSKDVIPENFKLRVVVMCCVNEDGEPLFTRADMVKLAGKHNRPIARLFDAALKVSRINDAAVEAAVSD